MKMLNLIKINLSSNVRYQEPGISILIDNEKVTDRHSVTFSNHLKSYFKNIRMSFSPNTLYG